VSADTDYSELEASGSRNFFSVTSEYDDAKDIMLGLVHKYGWSNVAVLHDNAFSRGT
jgi:hypothetical protein